MRLADLIHPIGLDAFRDTYWERRFLVVEAASDRFAALFASKDLGQLLRHVRPRPPAGIMLVKGSRLYDRRWTFDDGSPRLEDVRAAWRDGYTVVVNHLDRLWNPVSRLAARLTADMHHPVGVNLYASPPGTQGFVPHFDVMDSFILQLEGSKVWEVREPAIALPLSDEQAALPHGEVPPLVWEGELAAGSMLYVPRGHVHAARTAGAASFHLTVGVQTVTWLDLVIAAVSSVRNDARLRRALPLGFLDGSTDLAEPFDAVAADLRSRLKLEPALDRLAERLLVANPPPAGDDVFGPEPEVRLDTVLRRRLGVAARILERRGRTAIQYSGGKIEGPDKIAAALRHVVRTMSFAVGTLPGDLNDREKLVLARRLICEGLMEIGVPE
jgi:ribosomal protein L16 Arg81 hydroxylase